MKKRLCITLASIMLLSGLAGCGTKSTESADAGDKTVITVAGCPTSENQKNLDDMNAKKEAFEKENPDIKIETSTNKYATDTFIPKAMTGQLPTLFGTFYTEIQKIIEAGYAADITDMMTEMGMADALYPNIKEIVEKDGRLYGIPSQLYVRGLICNVELFKEAGLVDADGVPIFPQNYTELAETAKIIKDKTGKAGFAMPTTSNCDGWHFMNIAWSNGVGFMAKENNRWTAKFDTQACADTLQYIKDLKWKYDALPTSTFLAMTDLETLLSTDQLAMYFRPADNSYTLVDNYGMSKDNIAQCRVPEGSAGRVAQMGGSVYMIANNATEAQKEACGKWLDFIGHSAKMDDARKSKLESTMQLNAGRGYVVGITSMPIWITEESIAANKELNSKYCNVNLKLFEDYEKYDTVTIKPEEPQKCKELYSIIDSCMQSVLTDENADCAALIHEAADSFQKNYLDKLSENEF